MECVSNVDEHLRCLKLCFVVAKRSSITFRLKRDESNIYLFVTLLSQFCSSKGYRVPCASISVPWITLSSSHSVSPLVPRLSRHQVQRSWLTINTVDIFLSSKLHHSSRVYSVTSHGSTKLLWRVDVW